MADNIIAVIQAGGKGRRMLGFTEDKLPKPMLEINGKTIIEHQIELLKENGIHEIIIILGHLGHVIKNYFADGRNYGVKIDYIVEEEILGSAGALYFLKQKIKSDFFFVYADIFMDMNLKKLLLYHQQNSALVTLVAHPNNHPYDSNLLVINDKNIVCKIIDKKTFDRSGFDNIVNAGVFVISHRVLEKLESPTFLDMEKDIVSSLLPKEKVFAYKTPEYIIDSGSPERFMKIEQDMRKGVIKNKNLANKQKCIFLDRDGTVNVYKGFISDISLIELEQDVAKAIKSINESGYLAILVTNQAVVAMGLCEYKDVVNIHKKIAYLLGEQGAYLDDYIFCPHHPDSGFPNEKIQYKIACDCRKPNIGMIIKMADKYNIDLSKSWIVGDTTRDIMTGVNAGMHQVLVHTGEAGKDGKYNVTPELEADNLYQAVQMILKK